MCHTAVGSDTAGRWRRDRRGLRHDRRFSPRGRADTRHEARGIQPLAFFGQPTNEPWVIGWMPAATLYFRDPDGHMLEYLTMLDEPARPDAGIVPWSEWR